MRMHGMRMHGVVCAWCGVCMVWCVFNFRKRVDTIT